MTKPFTNRLRPLGRLLAALLFTVLLPLSSRAAPFAPGNIVVVRVGTGAAALGSTATAVFLDEYTPTGTLVQSVALPTADNGANQILTASGSATSEGILTRSADGRYLVLTGYDAALATAGVASTTTAAINRIIGRIAADGTINTATRITDAFSGNNIRSAASADGSSFYAAGGTSGVQYVALGNTGTSVNISTSQTNLRQLNIFNGNLYAASGSGTNNYKGVNQVGTGLPTTTGQTTTRLPGFTDTNAPSTYACFFADLSAAVAGVDVVYIADDGAGALTKFSLVGGTWTSNGTVGVAADAYRGLGGSVSGTSVTLVATGAAAKLVTITDASGYNGAFSGTPTVLATAATNTAFRGVAFAPVSPFTQTLAVTQGATSYPTGGATAYSFGNQNLNTTSTATAFTLTNSGAGAITINSIAYSGTNGANFATSGTAPTTIANGGTATLNTTFTPNATGTRTGTVTINYTNATGTGSYTFNLSGTGTNPANPLIAVSQGATSYPNGGATAYSFGSQQQSSTSAPVTFTISNASTTDVLNISGISTTGNFAVSGTAPTTVAANGTATFQLTFSPATTGALTGTVSIANDSQANNPYVINLSGTGTTPAPTITATSANGSALLAGIRSTILIQGTGFLTGAGVNTVTYSNGTVHSVANLSATILRVDLTPTGAGNLQVSNVNGPSGAFALTTVAPPVADLFEPFELYTTTVVGATTYNTSSYNTSPLTTPTSLDFPQTSGTVTLAGTLLSNTDLSTIASERRNNSQAARVRAGGYIEFARTSGVGTLNFLAGFYGTDNVANPLTAFTVTYSVNGGAYSAAVAGAPAAGSLPTALTPYSFTINQPGNVRVRISNTVAYSGSNVARINVDDVRISNFTVGDLTVTAAGQNISGVYNSVTITSSGSATVVGALTVNTALTVQNGGTLNTNCQPVSGAGSFTLAAGGTLGICDGSGISATGATGAVQTIGTRSFSNDATYLYNGTSGDQSTGSGLPTTVRNLTLDNGDGLALTQPLALRQVLRLSSGTLDTNGQMLTLLSVIGQGTALIDHAGGSITGAGTMQRAIEAVTGDNIGYHHFSSPVSNTTINDLAAVNFAFGSDFILNPAYNTATLAGQVRPFPTVLGYDERRITAGNGLSGTAASSPATDLGAFDKGFFSPASGDAMAVGKGYTANMANAALPDFTGTFNTGNITLSGLTRSTGTTTPDDGKGWQLLGNPYPSPLNWGTVSPTTQLVGMDAAIYQYHATSRYTGYYTSFVTNGAGGTGIQPIVDAGAGFFARVSTPNSTGSVSLTNANRVTTFGSQPAFGRGTGTSRPEVQLQLAGGTLHDDLFVYLDSQATAGRDAHYDAVKLANPTGLNLATVLANGELLAIDGRPALSTAVRIPLKVGVPSNGQYSLTAAAFRNVPATTAIVLTDALTGQQIDLRQTPAYTFTVAATAPATGRFFLQFTPAGAALATTASQLVAPLQLYPNPAKAAVSVIGAQAGALVQVVDALGRRVSSTLAAADGTAQLALPAGLAAGIYVVRSGTQVQRLTVE